MFFFLDRIPMEVVGSKVEDGRLPFALCTMYRAYAMQKQDGFEITLYSSTFYQYYFPRNLLIFYLTPFICYESFFSSWQSVLSLARGVGFSNFRTFFCYYIVSTGLNYSARPTTKLFYTFKWFPRDFAVNYTCSLLLPLWFPLCFKFFFQNSVIKCCFN